MNNFKRVYQCRAVERGLFGGHILHQLALKGRGLWFGWSVSLLRFNHDAVLLPRVHHISTAQTISISSSPLQLTESETQLMDLKRSLEIYWQVESWLKLMLFMKPITSFNLNPQRYPKYWYWWCIGSRKKLQCWAFKVSKFHRCNNSVLPWDG